MRVKVHYSKEFIKGRQLMSESRVSICSIVRDCEKNLKKNISKIEELRKLFLDSEVVIFENDSKDNTLSVLKAWGMNSPGIHVFSENYNITTIPDKKNGGENPFFSFSRIKKMTFYRNKYLKYLNYSDFKKDFVIIIDLDISDFKIDGIIHSFGYADLWDCISANGISKGSNFRTQYHDSYALIEKGKIDDTQTEADVKENRIRYSGLLASSRLLPVDSAYGGLAIYHWEVIKGLEYFCPANDDLSVQCKSEHVGLHKNMLDKGYSRMFINPEMVVKYRSITFMFLVKKLWDKISFHKI